MTRTYNNPWIPAAALELLHAHQGTLLDVGGGAAPYCGATHVLDALPFSAERLAANAWGERGEGEGGKVEGGEWKVEGGGGGGEHRIPTAPRASGNIEHRTSNIERRTAHRVQITPEQYTQWDLCDGRRWPFADKQFDLGLSSHCLEDLRDPLPAVRELARVCRQVLVIVPSRLFEQARGVDHPRYCGFPHHPWIVTGKAGELVFRRKTPVVMLPACHLVCPIGKTLRRELGCSYVLASELTAREDPVVWTDDFEDYRRFIAPYRRRRDLFVPDGYRHGLKYWVWRLRQRWFGAL